MRSKQELFRVMWRGVREQGRPGRDFRGKCLYLTEDGHRCAIGHTMPNVPELLHCHGPVLEVLTFATAQSSEEARNWVSEMRQFTGPELNMLQHAHDVAADIPGRFLPAFEHEMLRCARDLGLDPLPPETP